MSSIERLDDAMCLHREVQAILLTKRRKYLKNLKGCQHRTDKLDDSLRGEPRYAFKITVDMAARRDEICDAPKKACQVIQTSLF